MGLTALGPSPAVSVVVAAHRPGPALDACLAAHARELRPGDELVVVGPPSLSAVPRPSTEGTIRSIDADPEALTPRQWALGAREARGGLVRLTIAAMVPEAGWRAATVAAHAAPERPAAVGGAMEPDGELALHDWAVFFLRYRAYLPPFERRRVADVPGDHASYRREVLDETRALWRDELWERDLNGVLAGRGHVLVLDPSLRARFAGGERPAAFAAHRLRHGAQFGRARLAGAPAARRFLHAALFVAPGGLFLVKIVREVAGKRRYRGRLALALPWLVLFLGAWSLGEWAGSVRALTGPADPGPG